MYNLENIEKDLSYQFEKFYELNSEEKQGLLDSILKLANDNPDLFIKVLRRSDFNWMNNLPIYYEALSMDLERWSDFFIDEAKRLFRIAETSDEPKKILTHLDEFSFIDADKFRYRDEFSDLLLNNIDHKNATFRYYSICLLPDFIRGDDVEAFIKLKMYLTDKNWRIRYHTYSVLKDLNKLASNEKLYWLDSVRARFLDPYKFK